MPRLSDLTDYNYDPMGSAVPAELPVDKPFKDLKKVYITGEEDLPVKFSDAPVKGDTEAFSSNVDKIINSLFRDDDKRLQLWPEKLLRNGTTAAGRALTGELPQWAIDPNTGDVHTSPQMVEAAQEMSALAGTGGLGGTGGTLNATPSLRPALKHNGKLYKGKPGQEHMDVIPESMYPDFQKKAMNGEDIKEYNFGFINDKGHFLNREDALKYGIDNGLIDPQAGKYGALTSTLFADSSKPGTAIEAMKTANPFFSALEHNVKQISQSKMTGDQWLGTLGNKPGVKPEELQWTGLQDFLNENKGKPVTKAQIEEHLQNNKVELKEVTKGGSVPKWADLPPERQKTFVDKFGSRNAPDVYASQAVHGDPFGELNGTTKYHSYQLPGGSNYKEMLLTLPGKKASPTDINKLAETLYESFDRRGGEPLFKDLPAAKQQEYLTKAKEKSYLADNPDAYRSSHWDEPNILAHVRMNDRTIEGKKSLHLEEIQSDWHQQGREKGYKSEAEALNKKGNEKLAEYEAAKHERDNLKGTETLEEIKASVDKVNRLRDEVHNLTSEYKAKQHGVPDAPFKKSWHELALKRMLREASEKGYDRLSWTPGEAQAARYDLSKSVDKVNLVPDASGQFRIDAFKDNRKVMEHFAKTESEVSAVVGKEVAKKLFETRNNLGASTLAGQDLKIGGEGMKGFYDQIIPKSINKLAKEHGVKVETGKTKEGHAIHYIDIPQSLKDTAMHKGFPLFSAGGYMLLPVAGNPFEEKK